VFDGVTIATVVTSRDSLQNDITNYFVNTFCAVLDAIYLKKKILRNYNKNKNLQKKI